MIDDFDHHGSRRRRASDEPGWGDPFASYETLTDPGAAPGALRDGAVRSDAWRGAEDPDGRHPDGRGPDAVPSAGPRRGSRRPLLTAVLRPWFEPRPGELRGLIVLLALALAVSLALWFDASRRPTLRDEPPVLGVAAARSDVGPWEVPAVSAVAPFGSADGSDGWGSPAALASDGPVVHVSGAVREPGVVTLPRGSRVVDAIVASGGALPDARLDRLNLARRLEDGEQIHVPRIGEEPPPQGATASRGVLPDGRIDINLASAQELETLPGIGPARAQAIIAEREVRPFRVPGDLRRVPGIGEATFQRLAPLIAVQ